MKDIENIISSRKNREIQQMNMNAELENSKFQKSLTNYVKNASQKKKGKNTGNDDMLDDSQFKK